MDNEHLIILLDDITNTISINRKEIYNTSKITGRDSSAPAALLMFYAGLARALFKTVIKIYTVTGGKQVVIFFFFIFLL